MKGLAAQLRACIGLFYVAPTGPKTRLASGFQVTPASSHLTYG